MTTNIRPDPIRISSANTTNATLVKAGACVLTELIASNVGGAAAFLKLFDKATAPVPGTDVPVLTIPIPTAGLQALPLGVDGLGFQLGLGISITNLVADNDTTVIAAAQVKVMGSVLGS